MICMTHLSDIGESCASNRGLRKKEGTSHINITLVFFDNIYTYEAFTQKNKNDRCQFRPKTSEQELQQCKRVNGFPVTKFFCCNFRIIVKDHSYPNGWSNRVVTEQYPKAVSHRNDGVGVVSRFL